MILVYVCPCCQSVRIASRRKDVFCTECGQEMELSDLTFLEWSEMSAEQRKTYGEQWCSKKKIKELPTGSSFIFFILMWNSLDKQSDRSDHNSR